MAWDIIILASPESPSVGAREQQAGPVARWQSAALFLTQLSLCAQHTRPGLDAVTAAQRQLMNWDGPPSKGSMC